MSYYRQGPYRGGGMTVQFGIPALTPMVRALMIACAAVWLAQVVLRLGADFDLAPLFGVVPGAVARGWVWQPLTYMFLHAVRDPFHLVFNMLMLWMFGGDLERHFGSRAFLRYYLLCGLGGGASAVLLGLLRGGIHAAIPTVGASGALFGLLVAYGTIFAERTVLFMLVFPMKARTFALILFALSFFYMISLDGSGVSHVAHLGGALVGFVALKRLWRVSHLYRELRWLLLRRRFRVVRRDDDRWVN